MLQEDKTDRPFKKMGSMKEAVLLVLVLSNSTTAMQVT